MNHNYETAYVNALTSRLNEDSHDFEIMNKFKGYEGEQLVENLLKQQHQIVFSHNLEFVSSNAVQIDFLIIHNSQISILEVKHYYGDFEIYDNYIKNSSNKRYTSPFVQLYKAKNTLQSILQEINLNLPINHYLVFSNPTFTLRNHIPNRSQVLLRSEFYKFPKLFQSQQIDKDKQILQQIIAKQQIFSHRFKPVERVAFNKITKGIKCPECKKLHTIIIEEKKKIIPCTNCLKNFRRVEIYYFNIMELAIIKGKEGFTIPEAVEWCEANNVQTVKRICNQHFKSKGQRYKTYYLEEFSR